MARSKTSKPSSSKSESKRAREERVAAEKESLEVCQRYLPILFFIAVMVVVSFVFWVNTLEPTSPPMPQGEQKIDLRDYTIPQVRLLSER